MEEMKFVISELNRPPYNQTLSLVELDALEPLQLLQLLSDTLCLLAKENVVEARRSEAADCDGSLVACIGMADFVKICIFYGKVCFTSWMAFYANIFKPTLKEYLVSTRAFVTNNMHIQYEYSIGR
ncbi:stAR-related lipid transfer protein 9 [Trichinella spiralis]|uniref:stAR-related lipid transfer protein 9 n=1 Tax=Trichinella spiralis TaxID=6334 RepID=UPI0001EFC4EF|nr:stAR-related lipid transfer protein 9 [Trichinella spiralis]